MIKENLHCADEIFSHCVCTRSLTIGNANCTGFTAKLLPFAIHQMGADETDYLHVM